MIVLIWLLLCITAGAVCAMEKLQESSKTRRWKEDLRCLATMWFGRIKGESHKQRLDSFYSSQANAYDHFRAGFLHGREQMLASCAARLRGSSDLVWVDLGGGTAENVKMMSKYMDLSSFRKIYVVDLCSALCNVAAAKSKRFGWSNVEVIEGDACEFQPRGQAATLVTFSYSLSMIPPFMKVVDKALTYLADDGIMGVTDFYTSAKYDKPNRQHSWLNRWFWRSVFDLDGIDLGPERRTYLEHKLEPVCEFNGSGRIPYVPVLEAPYYIWIGRKIGRHDQNLQRFPIRASDDLEAKRPSSFPPTFLYSLSWEDPREDEKVLDINPSDVVLTLTSGGCNALDLVLQGAKQVVAVDMNPAQSYLLELKRLATTRLSFEDAWKMFGEGVHPTFESLLEKELVPFLSQGAVNFWRKKARYFKDGLYYHGGMGRLIRAVRALARLTRKERFIESLVNAPTLQQQRELWFACVGNWLSQAGIFAKMVSFFVTNRFTMWFCAGVCKGQLRLLRKEGNLYNYIVRCLNSTAAYSHLRDSNYFYRCCLTGKFSSNCCPRFLEKENFHKLKTRLAAEECLLIRTATFVEELSKRMYTKVILMDHVDWLEQSDVDVLCKALQAHVIPGGRVIWRSASRSPSYANCIEKSGFKVIQVATSKAYMDRVNMYASFFVAVRVGGLASIKIPIHPSSRLHDHKLDPKEPESPDSVLPAPLWIEI
ncbi:uncharacterized protein LOC9660589 [Selaginella moellendorffii]|uniref:uncharacterized protein LOC9660589 n=1 Tax=Selaginella moellendorffii TaxID=88036 RepID=UPI000D1C7D03|nr:uncharacterized protein LOC9660589 [Selaginella moellendorffii]|eukprot:XP_024520609.1 uncharacterized protein LOC9660589 [Selaginella moellendorffii]